MRLSKQSVRCRHGFTLIELLVVIAIIVILVGLAAGAFFKIEQSQNQKRTEATIKKVATGFQSQWNSVIDDVKNEIKNGYPPLVAQSTSYPTNLLTLAGGDRDRANALYMKMRLRQEFPQSFSEATTAVTIAGFLPGSSTSSVSISLPAKPFYTQSLATQPADPNSKIPAPVWKSAVCLYLALTESRRGAAFNADDIGAGSWATAPSSSLKYFVDSWGYPIAFERWPSPSSPWATPNLPVTMLENELFKAPYASPVSSSAPNNKDNQDPLTRLYGSSGWPALTGTTANNSAPVVLHTFDGYNRSPVIYSAGPNKTYGDADDICSFRLLIEGRAGY
jgi:prepilin-type N-terminal cleavage/methylation domain-containing protein